VLARNSLTWHATAAYKQALPTSNTAVRKHSMTSGMIVPPNSLILFSCIAICAKLEIGERV
jgi:hypothetical protein